MAADAPARRRRNRSRSAGQQRRARLTPRFSDIELAEITQAAIRAGLTSTGFVAQAAVAAARTESAPYLNPLRGAAAELVAARVAVNRVGTNLNQAVAKLQATGDVPPWLHAAVDLCARTVTAVDDAVGQLRKALP